MSAMPIAWKIDPDHKVVLVRAEGAVGDADLLDLARRLAADPRVRSGVHELVDVRDADLSAVSSEALREMAATFAAHDTGPTGARIAVVAWRDAAYGLSRMYQAYRGDEIPAELSVFRDMAEARAWLGLPPE